MKTTKLKFQIETILVKLPQLLFLKKMREIIQVKSFTQAKLLMHSFIYTTYNSI
jgi:hypothetical protein